MICQSRPPSLPGLPEAGSPVSSNTLLRSSHLVVDQAPIAASETTDGNKMTASTQEVQEFSGEISEVTRYYTIQTTLPNRVHKDEDPLQVQKVKCALMSYSEWQDFKNNNTVSIRTLVYTRPERPWWIESGTTKLSPWPTLDLLPSDLVTGHGADGRPLRADGTTALTIFPSDMQAEAKRRARRDREIRWDQAARDELLPADVGVSTEAVTIAQRIWRPWRKSQGRVRRALEAYGRALMWSALRELNLGREARFAWLSEEEVFAELRARQPFRTYWDQLQREAAAEESERAARAARPRPFSRDPDSLWDAPARTVGVELYMTPEQESRLKPCLQCAAKGLRCSLAGLSKARADKCERCRRNGCDLCIQRLDKQQDVGTAFGLQREVQYERRMEEHFQDGPGPQVWAVIQDVKPPFRDVVVFVRTSEKPITCDELAERALEIMAGEIKDVGGLGVPVSSAQNAAGGFALPSWTHLEEGVTWQKYCQDPKPLQERYQKRWANTEEGQGLTLRDVIRKEKRSKWTNETWGHEKKPQSEEDEWRDFQQRTGAQSEDTRQEDAPDARTRILFGLGSQDDNLLEG
ncbi:hypothetical protein P8C59_008580 [Phyllachora maydis]|uniref:Uncharacterized protein n=1 Tax=Phyllachora maydis TaxID=1825666 RepID=A0AAD9MFC2_9PEZI|nr:hypothetical protein P8C59_008580 [Phyllachora maydis]